MAELISHNCQRIETIYQLLGEKENDITRAVAWTLTKCPTFLSAFIKKLHDAEIDQAETSTLYQQYEKTDDENGYTDLEIAVIISALHELEDGPRNHQTILLFDIKGSFKQFTILKVTPSQKTCMMTLLFDTNLRGKIC